MDITLKLSISDPMFVKPFEIENFDLGHPVFRIFWQIYAFRTSMVSKETRTHSSSIQYKISKISAPFNTLVSTLPNIANALTFNALPMCETTSA